MNLQKTLPVSIFSIIWASLMFFPSFQAELQAKAGIKLLWQSEAVFEVPESVYWDAARKQIYVSNINGKPLEKDDNGYISKLDANGKIIEKKWISGLNAPKGMGVNGDRLFVTDIDRVVEISISQGKILRSIPLNGQFVNDIAIDPQGNVYASDMSLNVIYKIRNGKGSVWIKGLKGPNGLFWYRNRLFVASSGSGYLQFIDPRSKKIRNVKELGGGLDGIERVKSQRGWLISKWQGAIYFVSRGKATLLLDRSQNKPQIQSADIGFIPQKNILLVPTFFSNRIEAYTVNF